MGPQGDQAAPKVLNVTPNDAQRPSKPAQNQPKTQKVVQNDFKMDRKVTQNCQKWSQKCSRNLERFLKRHFYLKSANNEWILEAKTFKKH